jgi:hypothetical protein
VTTARDARDVVKERVAAMHGTNSGVKLKDV